MKRLWQYAAAAFIPVIMLFVDATNARGQRTHQFINPGIKLGYTFGNEGGFTFGVEVSVTEWDERDGRVIGGVIDWDVVTTTGRNKLHLGLEEGWAFVGLDIGPTWVFEPSGRTLLGFTLTPYGGALGYLYYSITIVPSGNDVHEGGLYLKAPLQTDKRPIFD